MSPTKPTIYIAGPYTHPCPEENVKKALMYATRLLDLGYYPFVPHLSHFWNAQSPQPYEKWLEYDFVWLAKCDRLLWLPGKSPGGGREVVRAVELGIPCFMVKEPFSQDCFVQWMNTPFPVLLSSNL